MKDKKKVKPDFDGNCAKNSQQLTEAEKQYQRDITDGEEERIRSAQEWAYQAAPNKYWPFGR